MVSSITLSTSRSSVTLTPEQWAARKGQSGNAGQQADAEPAPHVGPIVVPTSTILGQPGGKRVKVPMLLGDYQPGPDIREIAEALISERPEHAHLAGVNIGYYWRQKGGKSKRKPRFGYVKECTQELGYFAGHAFIVVLAADHCGAAKITALQLEALTDHELRHIRWDPRTNLFHTVGHDWEGFKGELQRYGAWEPTTKVLACLAQQLPLIPEEDAYPELAEDGDDDDDE